MTLHHALDIAIGVLGWACIALFWTAGGLALSIILPGLARAVEVLFPGAPAAPEAASEPRAPA